MSNQEKIVTLTISKDMSTAPTDRPILMNMKHGWIEGMWYPSEGVGRGYYWGDIEWFPHAWCELPND